MSNTETTSVKAVRELPQEEREVYDIGMKDNPKVFFANGVLVHNSVFYPALPIVEQMDRDVDVDDDEELTDAILDVADEVQDYINATYDLFASEFCNIPGEHRFDIKQELVAKSGIWVRKKRYAQWIINDEGHPTDELDVKGLDIIRSDFPEAFRESMEKVIVDILEKVDKDEIDDYILDFREELSSLPLDKIARPTGVKKLEKYSTDQFGKFESGTPVHVKASLCHNDLVRYYDLEDQVPFINSGEKIRWVYLGENPLKFDQLAFVEDSPDKIMEYAREYSDYEKMFEKGLKSKLEGVYDAMGWNFPTLSKRQAQKFFEI